MHISGIILASYYKV